MGLQLSQGASLFDSRGLTLRPCSGQASGEAGGWAWGCGAGGEVAPVVVSGAEGEEGVALGGEGEADFCWAREEVGDGAEEEKAGSSLRSE